MAAAAEEEVKAPVRRRIPYEEEDNVDLDDWLEEASLNPRSKARYDKWVLADAAFSKARNALRNASKCYDNTESEYWLKKADAAYAGYFKTEKKLRETREKFFDGIEKLRKK